MKQCPACKTEYTGESYCRSCMIDLGRLVDIEAEACEYREKALQAFKAGDYDAMFFHAGRSFSLRRNPVSERLLVCAALLVRRFELAVSLWKRDYMR